MASIHRGLNLAFAAVAAVVATATMTHLVTSTSAARLAGALGVAALGWAVILRLLRQTS
ncbi:MAG: hypothetical protein ACE14W_04800 [Candidatus Velamenicoccus archaeovorus]